MEIYEQQALAREDFLIHTHHMFRISRFQTVLECHFISERCAEYEKELTLQIFTMFINYSQAVILPMRYVLP